MRVPILTLGIINVWLGVGSIKSAAQLASILLIAVMILIGFERAQRNGRGFQETHGQFKSPAGYQLRGVRAIMASVACAAPIAFGFILPGVILAQYAVKFYDISLEQDVAVYALNNVILSGSAAIAAVAIAIFMAYALRLR